MDDLVQRLADALTARARMLDRERALRLHNLAQELGQHRAALEQIAALEATIHFDIDDAILVADRGGLLVPALQCNEWLDIILSHLIERSSP